MKPKAALFSVSSLRVCAFLVPAVVSLALLPGQLDAQNTAATFGKVIALGATPSDIVLDESRSQLYLVNTASNRIDVLSTGTNAVIRSITVGTGPLSAAISPDKAFLYVTNGATSTAASQTLWSVSVIDLNAGSVVQTVAMPAQPQGVAVGADGRALISTLGVTSGTTTIDTLLIFDRTQPPASQLTAVLTPPPPSTPSGIPAATLPKPPTSFLSKLAPTPDGKYIVGLTNTTTLTYMFVYEVSSGTILRSRTLNGQSTVLAMSPDGTRFMAGLSMFDIGTLAILGQMSNATAPFPFTSAFNTVANTGGSVFSPDGKSLYAAFNVTAASNPPAPTNSSTLLISDPLNLGIRLGIRLPESIFAKMTISSDGSNAWSLSRSGLIYLPLSTLSSYPILSVNSTVAFLSQNICNPGLAQAQVSVSNGGAGKLTYAVTTISSALTSSVSTGVAPSTITFTMEPGRLTTVARYPGTNLVSITSPAATLQGQSFDVTLASNEAINIPPVIRVYMNYRNPDQRGLVFPIPTTPNNSPIANTVTAACATATATTCTAVVDGDMGLQDILLDPVRNRVYISNAGYNRIEIFDTVNQVFLAPIPVAGPLPGQMTLGTGGNSIYVTTMGSELIRVIDLLQGLDTGYVVFPPLPRQTGGTSTTTSSPLVYPQALGISLSGLEWVMSDGTQWKGIGANAIPRPIDAVTTTSTTSNALPVAATTRVNMITSGDGSKILTLAGTGTSGIAYLYDALTDQYLSSALLLGGTANGNAVQGFYGPLGVGPSEAYFTVGGVYTNASLTQLGGAANPSTAAAGSPALRNVVATAPYDANNFVRLSTPVRTNLTTVPASDSRPTLEMVNINTGAATPLAVAPDNPRFTILGTTRFNVGPRSMVIDSNNVAYILGVSGLSVVPLTPGGATAPAILARNGVLNTSGSPALNVGGTVNISGTNLATAGQANSPAPTTVLGGSCVTFNSVPAALLQTSSGQITAQIPSTVSPGANVVQVRSIATGLQSAPVVVTVSPAASANSGTGASASQGVAATVSGRIGAK